MAELPTDNTAIKMTTFIRDGKISIPALLMDYGIISDQHGNSKFATGV
jgi:hypothetical protein